MSEEQTEYVNSSAHVNWPDSFSLVSEEQYHYREDPGTSFCQPSRSRTIDSSSTLLPSSASPAALDDKSSWLSKSRPHGAYLEAGPSTIRKSPSQDTGRSSHSGSFGSGDSSLGNQTLLKRASDASIDGRLRQMSLNSLRSEDLVLRSSSENTTLQPYEIPEQRGRHECPAEVEQVFLQSFDAVKDEVLDESWIRIATWWLLKVRSIPAGLTEKLNFSVTNRLPPLG